jgi:hypothetical protein
MHRHANVLRAAMITIAVVALLVVGRLISPELTPPSSPSTSAVAVTATSSAPATSPPPIPQPRHGRLVATQAARRGWLTYVDKIDRLSLTIPAGWTAKPDPIGRLSYPDPILAVGSWRFPIDVDHSCAPVRALQVMPADGALLWLFESRPTADNGLFNPRAFSPRPRSFDLDRIDRTNASCTDVPGYVVRFQEAGRYLSAEIVFGAKAPPSHQRVVQQILQSLRLT